MSNDNTRRAEFLAYFKDKLNSDRQVILDSGISKGRVTQYFDESEPFGELAARNLEKRLSVQLGTVFTSLRVANPEAKGANSLGGAIPVVGSAQLGDNGHFCDLEYPVGHGDGSIDWPTKDPNAYALRCNGESMKPRIRHGEYVVVEPGREVMPGDEVLVKASDGRVMVKQFAYSRDGMVHLDSVNEAHPRISLYPDQVTSIQYVAGIAKNSLWRET